MGMKVVSIRFCGPFNIAFLSKPRLGLLQLDLLFRTAAAAAYTSMSTAYGIENNLFQFLTLSYYCVVTCMTITC